MNTVWVMLFVFIVAPAPGPNPQAAARSYPSARACLEDIQHAVKDDAPKGKFAAVCVEGVIPQ